ncbi:GNAT family N-acetyltransferase [Desmospora activa]|uniref:Putative GNAT family N-acyltransferase n=1 Tax=Desmospora activa DSM 45169 TaxID=1121389 RepID=A0A2T4ZBN1_9BACL|nr:GNAT family N-acetyltransferase [Desmospora activa]PTM59310.1 putative GNAT family N-acyltransferase [Desmospora activa DSM 45169]
MKTTVQIVTNPFQKEQAMAIRFQVFVEEQQVPSSLEIDEWDNHSDVVHLLALQGEEAVGTARVRFPSVTTAKLERLATLPNYRGQGIGQLLMKQAEAVAIERGKKEMVLNAQVQALPFYHRLNYRDYGEPFDDAGIPHKTMTKSL